MNSLHPLSLKGKASAAALAAADQLLLRAAFFGVLLLMEKGPAVWVSAAVLLLAAFSALYLGFAVLARRKDEIVTYYYADIVFLGLFTVPLILLFMRAPSEAHSDTFMAALIEICRRAGLQANVVFMFPVCAVRTVLFMKTPALRERARGNSFFFGGAK